MRQQLQANAQRPPPVHVVIPCAGLGARAAVGLPKQYATLAGQPLVAHTLAAFAQAQVHQRLVVVLAPDDSAWPLPAGDYELLRRGGQARADSVRAGLSHLLATGADANDWVMVHDAARCLVQAHEVLRLRDACLAADCGGLLAIPLTDTLKQSDAQGRVSVSIERADKWLAQTPQMFRLADLLGALAADLSAVTDEASAMERMGEHPLLVMGSTLNLKVTVPPDFVLAEAVLRGRQARFLRGEQT